METNNENQLITQSDYMQMMPMEQAKSWYHSFAEFTKSILKENMDYGLIPGVQKKCLYKAGAEKLRFVYGLTVEFEPIETTVDRKELFVDYTYKCIVKAKNGQTLAQCDGNCNSMETKFGYVWLTKEQLPAGMDTSNLKSRTSGKKLQEFDFAITKGETGGQYGKPQEYWEKWRQAILKKQAKSIVKKTKTGKDMAAWELDESVTEFRVVNPDIIGLKNTIMKMAQKRAFVGAMLIATGASEFFTQDLEDMDIPGYQPTEIIGSNGNDVQDAEVVGTQINSPDEGHESPEPTPPVSGAWYAKAEKCRTPEDVDQLAINNKETVEANPEIRKLLNRRKAELKKELQHA